MSLEQTSRLTSFRFLNLKAFYCSRRIDQVPEGQRLYRLSSHYLSLGFPTRSISSSHPIAHLDRRQRRINQAALAEARSIDELRSLDSSAQVDMQTDADLALSSDLEIPPGRSRARFHLELDPSGSWRSSARNECSSYRLTPIS